MTENLNDLEASIEHGKRIKSKAILRRWYLENYNYFKRNIDGCRQVLELGSGAGFLKEVIPSVITSDVMNLPGCDMTIAAERLPFSDSCLDAILMIDVLHHIKNAEAFFSEAERCLVPKGKVLAIEPASTWWGKFIFKHFHHEPYEENAGWSIPDTGPLSGANIALPWIIFKRDRKLFESKFPSLKIKRIEDHTPFVYLLSGGVRRWSLLPASLYDPVRRFESSLSRLGLEMGMFWSIELSKE